jgi:dienelactone hydrolase
MHLRRLLFALASSLLALSSVQAKIVSKSVAYEHHGVKLTGYLAYDDALTATGRRPGILVIHEWWGLTDYIRSRADQLARLGYVAFALDMYGTATEDPKQAGALVAQYYGKPLLAERARAGLDQLLQCGLVDPSKVAVIGFCFGGAAAQALVYSGAPVAGLVSFHGGLIPAPAGLTGTIKTRFLLLNGSLDPTIKPEARAAFEKSLDAAKVDFQFIDYAGAVHDFSNPDATRIDAAKGLGGVIAYNEPAARRSWQQMQIFFDEIFGRTPPP